jgi:PilZ domain
MRVRATTLNLFYERKIVMREIKVSAYPTAVENSAERRRSHRVYITIPVIIRGKNGNLSFNEETHTASVSAHGCMVRLAEKVKRGQEVAILNPKTVEELPCTVTFVGQKESGKAEVGLEFTGPRHGTRGTTRSMLRSRSAWEKCSGSTESDGVSVMRMHLKAGQLLFAATLRTGTRTLASG